MEEILLCTAGIALIGGIVGLVIGTVHQLRPPGRKKRPSAASIPWGDASASPIPSEVPHG
jgi:hypothetical protein